VKSLEKKYRTAKKAKRALFDAFGASSVEEFHQILSSYQITTKFYKRPSLNPSDIPTSSTNFINKQKERKKQKERSRRSCYSQSGLSLAMAAQKKWKS
jgi:hypothetical protein